MASEQDDIDLKIVSDGIEEILELNLQDDIDLPDELPILPLRNSVFFPGGIIPVAVGREKSIRLLNESTKGLGVVGIFSQKKPKIDNPGPEDLFPVGTVAKILKIFKSSPDTQHAIVQGGSRIKITEFLSSEPYITAKVEKLDSVVVVDEELEALLHNLKISATEVLALLPGVPKGAVEFVSNLDEPEQLVNLISANLDLPVKQKMRILKEGNLKQQIKIVYKYLYHRLEVLRLSKEITSQVKGAIDKNQREYFLRQQLKVIQDELGEMDAEGSDIMDLKKRLKRAKIPGDAQKEANKELQRLSTMLPSTSEYTVSRTYLEWLADLPWAKSSKDNLDISHARMILDKDHYGLQKVKKRILEFLAVRKLKQDTKGPILCLVGPPGVGKTSLGQSIALALNRKFVRMSLGGIKDEAEIRGHRRTYVGALPGRIIQEIKRAGTNNPLFMLDEVDKLGSDWRGDPTSALLEVLDPEQNHSFRDHYLDLDFDLSRVIFIATANVLDTIPPALQDRTEVIEMAGYTLQEKAEIAKRHLIPKQIKEHGLKKILISIKDNTIDSLIDNYTREAGVRNLERDIAAICRWKAVRIVEGEKRKIKSISPKFLTKILGQPRFFKENAERTSIPGICTGLAWTPVGGDILYIEATKMKGKGKLIMTGSLGNVMQESAQAALSYVRSKGINYGIEENFMENNDIHIHVPAGSIQKDGPSAGITIFTALVSLLTGTRVKPNVALTGEITLRGMVLPVGGIKDKLLAAHRSGIKHIVLPNQNQKDLDELPEQVREELEFHPVKKLDQVFTFCLKKTPKNNI